VTCGPAFTATRMLRDYTERMYPAGAPTTG